MTEKLDLIRKKCIEAQDKGAFEVPCPYRLMGDENGCPFTEHLRPIRLADVLLAIGERFTDEGYTIDCAGGFKKIGTTWIKTRWNLRKDDLNDQSEETITFLADLLKP